MKNLFKEPIKRKIFSLVIIFFIAFAVIIVAEHIFHKISQNYETEIENQFAHRRLARVLIRELGPIEKNVYKFISVDDVRDFSILKKNMLSSIKVIESVLNILQNGGKFEDVIPANFDDIDEIKEKYSYFRDKNSDFAIGVIDLTPKILDIKQIILELTNTVSIKFDTSKKNEQLAFQKKISLLVKKSHTFLLRSRESTGRVFYDGHIEIQRLQQEQKQTMQLLTLIRYVIVISMGILGIIVFIRTISQIGDIIEERKIISLGLKEAHEFSKALLDFAPIGIMLIDPQTHKILEINKTALKLIGASRENIVGLTCHEFICPEKKGACPITDKKQTVNNSECVLLTTKGQRIDILKTVILTTIQGKECIVEGFLDIRELKEAEKSLQKEILEREKTEDELREYRDHLEDLVKRRAKQLGIANEQLKSELAERKKIEDQLKKNLKDLEQFKRITINRENRMIELKKEVNKLSEKLGRSQPHDLSFLEAS